MEPDAVEIRVLGCLIEKQRTTPDAYPLTLNALRLACNQSTNRDPVVDYHERDIRGALERLGRRRWTRLASWGNSRVMKYRHLLDETLELSDAELSLLGVLMLRGPQTPGELNQRSERLHRFEEGELERTLEGLIERELVRRLPRRPGERGQRFVQLLGGDGVDEEAAPAVAYDLSAGAGSSAEDLPGHAATAEPVGGTATARASEPASHGATQLASRGDGESARGAEPADERSAMIAAELTGRVEHLERELAALRSELRDLREQLGG